MQDDSEHPQTPETQRALAALHAAVASKVAAGRTAYDAAQSKIRVLATLKENLTQLAEELALAGEDHSGSAKPIPFSNLGRGLPVTPLWGEKPASASVKANCHDDETLELYNVSLRAMECLPGDLILLFDLINTDSDCHVKNLSWVVQNPRGCTVRLHADSNQVPPADVTVMGGVITLPSQWWDTTVTLLLRWTAVRSASETSVHWRKVNVAISNVHARWIPGKLALQRPGIFFVFKNVQFHWLFTGLALHVDRLGVPVQTRLHCPTSSPFDPAVPSKHQRTIARSSCGSWFRGDAQLDRI
ncbi:hypothetical protein M427DRAFT_344305 [Gonapodya prolifera JEL478]|uniref:Uncharacterized protein n=1 Tax=Gonapodya prolifera (strain JEL478) TaxID=1344416 RepID=A0A139AVN1_GONPJ|nr:hypothetical protein M427DRAFT_344305 [Gonapodya prolifera JEL478]|eukprot:KXS20759.1 hypothetical protein M427DRAFT_344305 [Gonapodya prolifera JEL478]